MTRLSHASLACGLLFVLAISACRDTAEPIVADRLVLENAPSEVAAGDSARLTAKVFAGQKQVTDAAVTWTSSDTMTATVDATGLLKAHSTGSVTITVRSGTLSEAATITIMQRVLFAGPAADSVQPVIALGPFTGCALSGGRTYCWGDNRFQDLGVGDTASEVLRPAELEGAFTFKGLYATDDYLGTRCGLTPNGKAVCWGTGPGITGTPTMVAAGLSFTTLAVGNGHICGVDAAGVVYCWGNNSLGQTGRPGTPTIQSALPVPLPEKMVSVTAGREQACALSVTGVVYCWGMSGPGLGRGDGPLAQPSAPAPVQTEFRFARLYGGTSNCALTRMGEVYCWGAGAGYGDVIASTPTRVPTALRFVTLSKPSGHTCGVTRDNLTYCWGRNEAGQLGVAGGADILPQNAVPVSGGLRLSQIATAEQFSCGSSSAGAVYCWGTRRYGRLGDGYSWVRPSPVALLPQLSFADVSGYAFSAQCALTTAGHAYCWGAGMGPSVSGSASDVAEPVLLSTTQTFNDIDVGRENACALDMSGKPWCYGASYTTTGPPVVVQTNQSFMTVSTGAFHACALTADGTAYCWGENGSGQLGTGDFVGSTLNARAVATNLRFTRISAASTYTCGIAGGGALYCWGGEFGGRMGHAALDATCGNGGGGATQQCTNTPKPVGDMPPITEIGTTDFEAVTCGMEASGRVYCLGRSETAPERCFFGSFSSETPCQRTPTLVSDGQIFHALYRNAALNAAGLPYRFTPSGTGYAAVRLESTVSLSKVAGQCGLTDTQKLYCWGSDERGTVGDNVGLWTSNPAVILGSP